MRLLLYNIRYGLGLGAAVHWPLPGAGFLLGNRGNLQRITDFIKAQDPDIVGLVEVDTGSIRTRRVNQAEVIGRALGHYSVYQCKYGVASVNQYLPILRKQGNAFLAAPRVHGERFHYFEKGIKRLIIELELEECAVFLVHLSLKYRHRQRQLHYLHDLVVAASKPVIIAGDFNTFWGEHEIYLFMKAAKLRSANARGLPSYPSRSPRKELDFVLYGDGINVTNFAIPAVSFSDHLPLICDFEIEHKAQGTARYPHEALATLAPARR
jgi:endonuclease/exonuclease/phosphatase family metal-dependent hydrolase